MAQDRSRTPGTPAWKAATHGRWTIQCGIKHPCFWAIIIGHAKRTMAAADVLYGVTMQESGMSNRIAIKFEDWSEEERRIAA